MQLSPIFVVIYPPARPVVEIKKPKEDKERNILWETGCSPRQPTSSDKNQFLHVGRDIWKIVLSFKFRENQLRGFGDPGSDNCLFRLLWLVAYITCATIQAVIIASTSRY